MAVRPARRAPRGWPVPPRARGRAPAGGRPPRCRRPWSPRGRTTTRPTNSFSLVLVDCHGRCSRHPDGRCGSHASAAVLRRSVAAQPATRRPSPCCSARARACARRAAAALPSASAAAASGVDEPGRDQHRDPLQAPRGRQQGREHGAGPARVTGLQPRAGDAEVGVRAEQEGAAGRSLDPVEQALGLREHGRIPGGLGQRGEAAQPVGLRTLRTGGVEGVAQHCGRAVGVTAVQHRAGEQRVRGRGRTRPAAPDAPAPPRHDRAAAPGRTVPAAGRASPGGPGTTTSCPIKPPRRLTSTASAIRCSASSHRAAANAGMADSNTVHSSSLRSPRRRSSGSSSSITSVSGATSPR